MKRGEDFARKEGERRRRRKIFHTGFFLLFILLVGALLWAARPLILPVIVGAFFSYLFRPVKERFKIPRLPHELQVLGSFAAIGLALFVIFNNVRAHIPDEKQKLELKVRMKYKLNEKYQQFTKKKDQNVIAGLFLEETAPVMEQINHWLDLSDEERELFLKYRAGYKGEAPIEDKFFDYFQANQTAPIEPPKAAAASPGASLENKKLADELAVWILAPLVFIFLGFDNGQMRRYFIGLVPNRYFELSLTVLDMLDEAIGNYLRGTLMECSLVGLTLTVGLVLLGIPISVAVAIGVVSGLINAVPFLGTVIGLIIGVGYALIAEDVVPLLPGLHSADLPIYVVVLVGVAHLLDNVVFQPFVLGHAVNVHPLVVMMAIMIGSLLMGLWGMLFAIPTVVVIKTTVETLFKELKAYRII